MARTDLAQPDWFLDPVTGRRAPSGPLCLPDQPPLGGADRQHQAGLGDLPAAAPDPAGHCLVVTGTSGTPAGWPNSCAPGGEENPFLSGVHWTSGIEVGIRLISLAWIRRLLDEWPGVTGLFERDRLAVQQIHWHQQYLVGVPEPWLLSQQPCHRRGRRAARGQLRLPVVPDKASAGGGSLPGCSSVS